MVKGEWAMMNTQKVSRKERKGAKTQRSWFHLCDLSFFAPLREVLFTPSQLTIHHSPIPLPHL
jgi:hypothetical protein